MSHTPTPWVAAKSASGKTWYLGHRGGPTSFTIQGPPGFPPEFLAADAEYIVRAVNSHADLLEALEELAERCESCNDEEKHHEGVRCWLCMECGGFKPRTKARAAIAKARGTS